MKKPRHGKDGDVTSALLMPNLTTEVGTNETKEGAMDDTNFMLLAKRAVLAMAEIKAATEAFERGDTNVFDALDAVTVAIEGLAGRDVSRRDAA